MVKPQIQSAGIYLFAATFILSWWILAFGDWGQQADPALPPSTLKTRSLEHLSSPYLAPLSRQKLHRALLGDSELMVALMAEWDAEARLLEATEHSEIQRLSSPIFLKAQFIGRKLRARQEGIKDLLAPELHLVFDDQGSPITPLDRPRRFLPQTYVAASFLLALASPEQIIALPAGMRRLQQLYPKDVVEQIHLDIGPHNTESLYRENPDIAFVAHYSQPSTIEALRNQGIELFTLSHIDSLEEIQDAILRIGHVAGRPEEAELLSYFMEAALCALNNRLALAEMYPKNKRSQDILYLNHFTQFSAPSFQTLTGKLLSQLGINRLPMALPEANRGWQIPLHHEHIIRFRPQAILLSAADGETLRQRMLTNPAFRDVPAVRNGRIYTVDADVQNSACQLAILAYYDLVHTLLELQAAL